MPKTFEELCVCYFKGCVCVSIWHDQIISMLFNKHSSYLYLPTCTDILIINKRITNIFTLEGKFDVRFHLFIFYQLVCRWLGCISTFIMTGFILCASPTCLKIFQTIYPCMSFSITIYCICLKLSLCHTVCFTFCWNLMNSVFLSLPKSWPLAAQISLKKTISSAGRP